METTLGSDPAGNSSVRGFGSAPRLLFLVGFMGAGKTTVGKALARRLGWEFQDLDEWIVQKQRRSIEQIFRELGEAEFRRAEHAALCELLSKPRSVCRIVALGGGAFVQAENAALIAKENAPAVFLDAPVEVLFLRCQEDRQVERPLRRSREEFARLYEARRPHYLTAGLRVDTGSLDIESAAQEVVRHLGLQPQSSFEGDES